MQVQLRSFANIREIIGAKSILLELPVNSTLTQLLLQLQLKYPSLQSVLSTLNYIFVLNDEYITADKFNSTTLLDQDSIVILPPSGGG